MRRTVLVSTILVATLSFASPAMAHPDDDSPDNPRVFDAKMISDDWNVRVGGYVASFRTEAALTPADVSLGGLLVLESDLGIEPSSRLFRAEGVWRFAPRHTGELSVFDVNRTAQRTLTVDIDWDGNEIFAGADVDTTFDTLFVNLGYRYSFWNNGRLNAGLSTGLSLMDLDMKLDASGEYRDPDGVLRDGRLVEGASLVAPLPSIGIFVEYGFTPNVVFRSRAQFFDISVDGTGGRVIDTEFGVDWYLTKTFGLGASGSGFDISIQGEDDGSRYQGKYRVSGIFMYATFAWGGATE
jgi:hypothetical protein